MTTPSINDVMSAFAKDAVDFARQRYGISLDYSPASVEQVEAIADKLFQSIPKGFVGKLFQKGPSDEEIKTASKMLGSYIGEVLRGSMGGDWAINQELSAIGIQTGETWVFPPSKVHKRLTEGPGDNLWFYFRALLDQPPTKSDA